MKSPLPISLVTAEIIGFMDDGDLSVRALNGKENHVLKLIVVRLDSISGSFSSLLFLKMGRCEISEVERNILKVLWSGLTYKLLSGAGNESTILTVVDTMHKE